jgi:hypothetical protein
MLFMWTYCENHMRKGIIWTCHVYDFLEKLITKNISIDKLIHILKKKTTKINIMIKYVDKIYSTTLNQSYELIWSLIWAYNNFNF